MELEGKAYHSLSEVPLADVVEQEYKNYQIYTLMDRAIPYLEDGLKPCQRRILFTLWKSSNKGLMKVSSATGLVLTLHPHGPPSIESSIVNMAQDFTFSNNYPLIDKKGYFGERMETAPAASRYLECKIGEVAELLLFDDINQVKMIPNYDEKVMEPVGLLPKLPLMLLNGAEGIGTGFSSVIPSFNHKDIVDSMMAVVKNGKAKKLKPWMRHYKKDLSFDEKGKIVTEFIFEEIDGGIFITELPKGFDAQKIYKHLSKFIEKDFIKDFIDSSVDNDINIEIIFKKGFRPTLEEVAMVMGVQSSITPNYTLISERGVKIFHCAEEIIEIFTKQRLGIVKRRYELLAIETKERLNRNQEIIRFIEEKHYIRARQCANRKEFVDYLIKKDFLEADYLADMAIYRLTQDEVNKRNLMIVEDKEKLKQYQQIAKSDELIRQKLIEELKEIGDKLSEIFSKRDRERKKLYQKLQKVDKSAASKKNKKN
ncbi:MAG: hypothetical protein HQK51_05765 [Oligoflexia bacterium]|nr:hypothetical protein [Oligoflexia bacterium]